MWENKEADNRHDLINPLDAQELRSGKFLKAISTVSVVQARDNLIFLENMPTVEENVIEMSIRKSTDVLSKNLEKISKIDVDENLSDEMTVHMEAMERERLGSAQHLQELKSLRGEELIKQRQRASLLISRKISLYPTPAGYTGINEIQRRMQRLEDPEKSPATPADASLKTLDTRDDSENIGVQSMLFEMPPTVPLSLLDAAIIVNVLRETLDQLAIIRYTIPAKIDDRWNNDSIRNVDEEYGVPDEPDIMFREEMGLLPLIPAPAEKIQRERNYVHNIVQRTVNEIENSGRFVALELEVDSIAKLQEAERNLEANCQIWMNQLNQLRDLIVTEKKNNVRDMKRTFKLARQTNAQVDDVIFFNGSKLGFSERWEGARHEQQNFRLATEEQELAGKINEYLKMLNADEIISGEVRTYLEAYMNDLEEEIVAWNSHYNDELELKQSEVDELKELVEIQKVELQNMRNLRDQRRIFIDECLIEEGEMMKEEEYWNAIHSAATIIQSQWRGYVVRHQLGPFQNLWTKLMARKKAARKARKKTQTKGQRKLVKKK